MKGAFVVVLSMALSACSPEPGPTQFVNTPPEQITSLSIADGGKCSIDSINNKESDIGWTVHRGEVITVGGWVLDLATKTTSDWVILRLDAPDGMSHFYAPTTVRGERADLYKVFGDAPGLHKATFTLVASPGQLPLASYRLVLLHQSAQGGQACTVPKTLNIVL